MNRGAPNWLQRRRETAARDKDKVDGKSASRMNWIAIGISVVSLLVAGTSTWLQWRERTTPFQVEQFVARLTSYREVSAATRELVHDAPAYILYPDRRDRNAREKVKRLRNIFEANAMMWQGATANELEELAHSLDLVLLGLDGVRELKSGPGVTALVQGKAGAGNATDREKLLNDVLNHAVRADRLMQHELDLQRNR